MEIRCERPNSAIHQFNGSLRLQDQQVGLDVSSLLLRGSTLRNTRWIVGAVVYTGRHTKLVMNSRGAPFKTSGIEKTMNNILLVVLAGLFILSAVSLIFYIIWTNKYYDDLDYLCYNSANSKNIVFRTDCVTGGDYSHWGYFFTFFILYSNFLPISLYVTVEITNYYQAYYIDNDLQMYDSVSDTPAVARTSNMNADLGMVEYIFSDKTGTLTDNIMRFKRCSVAGIIYGSLEEEGDTAEEDPSSPFLEKHDKKEKGKGMDTPCPSLPITKVSELSGIAGTPLREFVLSMAVCHTCVVEAEGELRLGLEDTIKLGLGLGLDLKL
jgi:phospholipid-transporting ATPase